MALEDLYREVILDHYRNPRNRSPLIRVDAAAEGVNPLCGDEISISLTVDGDTVSGIAVGGHGCSISQSSASMMSEAVRGHTLAEIADTVRRFKQLMSIESTLELDPEHPGAVLGDLEALQGVRQYPVRIKCADLAWTTLEDALAHLPEA